jgi:hypothetical protein
MYYCSEFSTELRPVSHYGRPEAEYSPPQKSGTLYMLLSKRENKKKYVYLKVTGNRFTADVA